MEHEGESMEHGAWGAGHGAWGEVMETGEGRPEKSIGVGAFEDLKMN